MGTSGQTATDPRAPGMRFDRVILAVFVVGLALRAWVAATTIYLWDEEGDWLPLASSIHVGDGQTHLPLRGYFHGILPAYLIRLGTLVAGTSPFGYRFTAVVAGSLTILVVARVAFLWRGVHAARIAAFLMAFNEYHIGVSVLATEKVFNLLFAAMAILWFVRFGRTQQVKYLFLTAVACGLAALAKETGFLLVAALGAWVLVWERKWLARPQAWAAVGLFLLIVLPDFIGAQLARTAGNATYEDHLRRIGGIGFTPYYLSFYLRHIASQVYGLIGGRFIDYAEEYPSMSVLNGVVLLGAAVGMLPALFRPRQGDRRECCVHLFVFWGVLLFFMATRPSLQTRLNPIVWFWVDQTMLAAIVLAAAAIAMLWTRAKIPILLGLGLIAGYASYQSLALRLNLPEGPKAGLFPPVLPAGGAGMVDVRATILTCATCRLERAELADIQVRQPDGKWLSAIGTPRVVNAEPGKDDRDFTVAPASPSLETAYRILYDVTSNGGDTTTLSQELRPLHPGRSYPPVRPWTRPSGSRVDGRTARRADEEGP